MPVKFEPDRLAGVNVISRQEPGRLWVNGELRESSVIVPWRGPARDWAASHFEQLGALHFERLLALEPEVVIVGSGRRIRFVPPALLRPLIERGIGAETMDTAAACRTFNVLASEGRSVVAALLVEAEPAEGGR